MINKCLEQSQWVILEPIKGEESIGIMKEVKIAGQDFIQVETLETVDAPPMAHHYHPANINLMTRISWDVARDLLEEKLEDQNFFKRQGE